MTRLIGPRTCLLALIAGAGVCAGIGVTSACLTDPPPDLTSPSNLGPEIVHTALVPAEGSFSQWPVNGEFVVPVLNVDPSQCFYSMTIPGQLPPFANRPCGGVLSDGKLLIEPSLNVAALSPDICNQLVTFSVATQFINGSVTAYEPGQGDTAQWYYSPPSCFVYDAGAVQGGGFPEAAVDGFVVPESGAE